MEDFALKCYNDFMRILSGIRASGSLHLGNYLGAIQQWIDLQRDHEVFYMVADLHAITSPYEPRQLRHDTRTVVAEYLAAGLDPQKATIFLQSHVPAHAELMWILASFTPVGELERMTQYKDKVQRGEPANAGLLTYPILMAADILLYRADGVPVGEDQVQHVEFARTIARKFNRDFGKLFAEPKAILTEGKRIMSLRDPAKKMSKTNDEPLYLSDEPAVIWAKLARAVTATTGGTNHPGVKNLFVLLKAFAPPGLYKHWEINEQQKEIQYSGLKRQLAGLISDHFADFRATRKKLLANPKTIDNILEQGVKKANAVAEATLADVHKKTGLR